jgi:hypothetical protein
MFLGRRKISIAADKSAQRPRTVGANQNKNTAPPAQQNANANEEVDEGDVVRVETQLVTVPAVVTDKNGHPLPALEVGKLFSDRGREGANADQLCDDRSAFRNCPVTRYVGFDASGTGTNSRRGQ